MNSLTPAHEVHTKSAASMLLEKSSVAAKTQHNEYSSNKISRKSSNVSLRGVALINSKAQDSSFSDASISSDTDDAFLEEQLDHVFNQKGSAMLPLTLA